MRYPWILLCFCLCIAATGNVFAEEARCESNQNCDFGLYCEKPIGKCSAEGTCQIRPEVCTTEFKPVCGCDGQTYSNACNAARAGVSVSSLGECPGAGETGAFCLTNENCDFGLFCYKSIGACKGPGYCEVRPAACPTVEDPVCGCDGQTYSNSCFAYMAGVSVLSPEACKD